MSGAEENRAAVFTSQPQAVEVHERGGWLPASMLGWRHDSDGVCSAWVRVEFAGVVEDAWVELSRLRLPQPPAGHLTRGAPSTGRSVPPGGGRRRAPETGEFATTPPAPVTVVRVRGRPVPGRHRAPAERGRHRAADTGMPAALAEAPPTSPRPGITEGGLPMTGIDAWPAPPARSELPPAGPVVRGQGVRGLDPERLTHPVRLHEGVGSVRPSRRDSLSV